MPKPFVPRALPKSIWILGLVSLFMDASSELVHSLLPIFLVSTLHTSISYVGVIAGLAESTALIIKIFSGVLSDYFGRYKPLAILGYGLAALSKPLFPLANTANFVLGARFIDRIGKGLRGAPRDALMGEISPPSMRGAAFGLRQSLDTVGAVVGPLVAIAGMLILSNNIRAVLWIAVFPALVSLLLLIFGIKEPQRTSFNTPKTIWHSREILKVDRAYWQIIAIAGILSLARISDAFLILKAQESSLNIAFVPLVMVVMNIFYASAAYPAGKLSDRVGARAVLLMGTAFLTFAHLSLALGHNLVNLSIGVVLWGLHMGFTQGLLAALISDIVPAKLRGTAYGLYYLVCGIAMLLGSILAGRLWDLFGSSTMFYTGAIISVIALISFLFVRLKKS